MTDRIDDEDRPQRRDLLRLGGLGLAGAAIVAASAEKAAAQAPRESLLRTVGEHTARRMDGATQGHADHSAGGSSPGLAGA